jgi:hypothetical protein
MTLLVSEGSRQLKAGHYTLKEKKNPVRIACISCTRISAQSSYELLLAPTGDRISPWIGVHPFME